MSTMIDRRRAQISAPDKARLKIMFLAKHACGSGALDPVDGNHAIYHHELRTTLEQIGLTVEPSNSYDAIQAKPDVDFVFSLLNRAGFQNSEMLSPLLLARHGLPFLGASPILRGLADDKHLMKVVAHRLGVPTAAWISLRRGAPIVEPGFRTDRLVVKPNASSASWGVNVVSEWSEARRHVEELQAQGHDVIVEEWLPLLDVAAPVIGGAGLDPWLLPPMAHQPDEPGELRSYEEKRALVPGLPSDPLRPVENPELVARIWRLARTLSTELWPFDYGRFEFRLDPASGDLSFMEVNLSCNLWSQKSISRAAATLGMDHAMLVECILAHSLMRQGVIAPASTEIVA